jgi:large subunit ribosomal protein L1
MSFEQAVEEAVQSAEDRNFTESVDLVVNFTGLDLSDPENRLNDDLRLPYRPDEEVKIAVIGDTLVNATDSADKEITEEELENIFDEPNQAKDLADEFSFIIAEAPLMPKIGMPKIGQQLGQVLGPRDMMPDPMQPGEDPTEEIESLRNTVSVRIREDPLLQVKVGEESFDLENVADNAEAVYEFVSGEMPNGDNNIKSVLLKTTMGSPVEVEV